MSALDNLVALLGLEMIEENIFRGHSQDLGFPQLFGGQVLGQALSAATRTPWRESSLLDSSMLQRRRQCFAAR